MEEKRAPGTLIRYQANIRRFVEAVGLRLTTRGQSLESTKIYTQVSFERTRRIAELFSPPGA